MDYLKKWIFLFCHGSAMRKLRLNRYSYEPGLSHFFGVARVGSGAVFSLGELPKMCVNSFLRRRKNTNFISMKIDWRHSSPEEFQSFCNALLWLEIDHSFEGFEATGKDGGIDGLYNGKYGKRTGTWRFQYKYHSTARKVAFQSLKKDVVSEIEKIKNEDHLVLLTNVPISPQEKVTIRELIIAALQKADKSHMSVELWDGAKINRLYLKFPLLKLWLEEGFSSASLIPYRQGFQDRLDAPSSNLNTLSNFFVARQEEIAQLRTFLDNKNQFTAIITGETGIGKTRLVVKFFQQCVDQNKRWTALKVDRYSLDFDKINFALSAGGNYILLVDDAQTYSPEILADLNRLGGIYGKVIVKVIFTIRSLEASDSLQLIREFDREKALHITLDKLSIQDTKTILERELQNPYLQNFIDQLVYISRGRPILIVAILNAAANNENITSIKTQNGFNDYVMRHFDTFVEQIIKQTGVEKLKVHNLLKLICLLEPIPHDNPTLIQKIAETEGVSEDFVILFLEKLRKTGISSGSYQQSIKPDYYSDIVLMRHAQKLWVQKKFEQYSDFTSNILTNLASMEEVEHDNKISASGFLHSYLESYVTQMDNVTSEEFIARLNFLRSITIQKPLYAAKGITVFIAAIQNPNHPFVKESWIYKNKEFLHNDSTFGTVKGILHDLLYFNSYYDFVFDAIMSLYKLTSDKSLFGSTFDYHHSVYVYQHSIQIQKFFVRRVQSMLPPAEENSILYIIHCLHELLKLSFHSTRTTLLTRHSFRVVTHYLPQVSVVEEHRLSIQKVLQQYYHHYESQKIKVEAVKTIIDIPREMAATNRGGIRYKSNLETKALLDFLETEAPKFDVACKKEVLDELYWYKKQRVPKKFHPQLKRIEKALKPRHATDDAVQLLTRLENELLGVKDERHTETDTFITTHTAAEIATALHELFSSPTTSHCFTTLLDRLIRQHTDKAKDVYIFLKDMNQGFVYWYGSNFLRAFRKKEELESFFWQEVQYYLVQGNSQAHNLLLHIYCSYWIDSSTITDRDAAIIKEIFPLRSPSVNGTLVLALPALYFYAPAEGRTFLETFLKDCKHEEADTLFRLLFEKETKDNVLEELFLKSSIPFALTYSMERCLTEVANERTTEEIFQYFMNRFSYGVSLSREDHFRYEFVPTSDHARFSRELPKEKCLSLLAAALKWYMFFQGDWHEEYVAKDLVEYLQPGDDFTEDIAEVYKSMYTLCESNSNAVAHLLETLAEYHNKCEKLVAMVSSILEDVTSSHAYDKEALALVCSRSRDALSSAGVKSGTLSI
jgi:hypothetical protein